MKNRVQLTVDYLGGHPAVDKAHKDKVLVVDDGGVHYRHLRELFTIPWSEVTAVAIDGPEQASKRITATRLVTIGVFALAAKKNTTEAYLQVDTADMSTSFAVHKMSAGELRGKLGHWVKRLPEPPTVESAAAAGSSSVADELAKLAQLRDQGVLSAEEFDAQKARLLA